MRSVLFLLMIFFNIANAEIFKCVENGHITYSATPTCKNAGQMTFDPAPPQPVPPKTAAVRKITLTRDAIGMFRGNGTVENVPVVFLVDTGASETTISGRVASTAGFYACTPSGSTETANGKVTKCAVNADISFGKFSVRKHRVHVLQNMSADMLLGQDILQQLKVEQEKGTMTLSIE